MATKLPLKIAVVIPKYGLVGGGEGFAAELSLRMADIYGYNIHVFANEWLSNSNNITFHKVPIYTFPKWLTTVSFAWFANKKIENIGGFDLVHTHERIFKADICSMHFVPHRFWVEEIRKKRLLTLFDLATIWVEKKMLSSGSGCKYLLPVSTLAAEKLHDTYPEGHHIVSVVPPGVKEIFFQKNVEEGKKIRTEFNVSSSDFLMLFVGMNFELKGLDNLLLSMAEVCAANVDKKVKLLVVGKGNKQKYSNMAKSLGLEKLVFFAGIRHDMPNIYEAVDLFVLLSGFDTFGMVVTEAMAAGLPVIVSNNVGAKDFVIENKNGFVVNNSDIKEISKKITAIIGQCKGCLLKENKTVTEQDNNWDSIARMVDTIYQKCLTDG